jgi:Toprim-like/Protein of unknown function (DUF3991)
MSPLPNRQDELEEFKHRDLVACVRSYGYKPVTGEVSRNSVSLKNESSGHKIVVTRKEDGHFVYFSANGGSDSGTIIDFCAARENFYTDRGDVNVGKVRVLLRGYSPDIATTERSRNAILLRPISTKERGNVVQRLATMPGVTCEGGHAYLKRRGLGADILTHERFINRIRTGEMGEAVFPHYDKEGICGYEQKNQGFTGFSPGGTKGVWVSNTSRNDSKLFIGESSIDCLSHFAIHKDEKTRYISTGGSWNDKTPELIKEAVAKHPGNTVILGFDNDDGGKAFEKTTRELLKESGKEIITQWPTQGKDWNDQLSGKDSRKEKTEAKAQEQPEVTKTTDPAKDYLKELQAQRPQRPQEQPQQNPKGRNFGR